ncbi:polysaccharide biosynthesis/export family protein [Flavobacterium sp.]|jgi:polysaccharide export outer membrane protein|uniref:polysaccharide biosynthesis/export family protein n=1 Tax=Flavobacterium sp. TaxID=239 RepID=UPI0037BEFEEA
MKKIVLFFLSIILITSCTTKKDIVYFQDIKNKQQSQVQYVVPKIQINDILNVNVSALNPEAVAPFNQQLDNLGNQSDANMKLRGYLVSAEGNIVFPIVGKIKLAGTTPEEAEDIIKNILVSKGLLVDPVISVRLLNGKITILGDISKPGTYPYSEQNITLLQALGYASDLSISGIRKDILVIREENGTRTYGHIDMTKTDWFDSPYYYIKQNDVIYVYPNGPKIKSAGYLTNLSTVLSVVASSITLILLITRL